MNYVFIISCRFFKTQNVPATEFCFNVSFFFAILGSCIHFAIDAIKEVVILFENIYEIYGDIQGASNAFKIKGYEQGMPIINILIYFLS